MEKKSNEIPLVVTSEEGTGQTWVFGSRGCRTPISIQYCYQKSLERDTREGNSPVRENNAGRRSILSKVGHVKSGLNLGGPLSKPKKVE